MVLDDLSKLDLLVSLPTIDGILANEASSVYVMLAGSHRLYMRRSHHSEDQHAQIQ